MASASVAHVLAAYNSFTSLGIQVMRALRWLCAVLLEADDQYADYLAPKGYYVNDRLIEHSAELGITA
jgi:hypothetical protein